ncbi:MAG: hypothetical protein ACJ72G_11775 [Friedmanniella sp.]
MRHARTIATITAALALTAAPALADKPPAPPGKAKGTATAPGQLCKSQSRHKTNHGKGKSPFAACVVGATRAQRDAAGKAPGAAHTPPAKLCADQSHRKAATDPKSPFAACVSGAAKAQHTGA